MRALLALILLTGTAFASSYEDELARAHFLSGQSYFDEGRFVDALHEFREAYRISRRPGFEYNVALCEERLGQLDAAIVSFERYLRESPAAPDRAAVEKHVAELRSERVVTAPPPPVRSRGWIWGLVGGAAVIVITGVAVGVVVGTRSDSLRTLPDVRPQ